MMKGCMESWSWLDVCCDSNHPSTLAVVLSTEPLGGPCHAHAMPLWRRFIVTADHPGTCRMNWWLTPWPTACV